MACCKSIGVVLLLVFTCGVVNAAAPVRSFGKAGSISHYFPPPRLTSAQMPAFQRGEPRMTPGRLDDYEWVFVDSLVESRTPPEAVVPTGILFFPSIERGLISSWHTIFRSEDGGANWRDANRGFGYESVEYPNYVYGMAANSSVPGQMHNRLVYLACMNMSVGWGYIRKARFPNPYSSYVDTNPYKTTDYWLGHIMLPDTAHLTALGSWDGYDLFWEAWIEVDSTGDSTVHSAWTETLIDPGGWVTGPMACVGGFLYAVGTRQWVSSDTGRTWQVRPSADGVFDGGVAFVDTLYGWTGGGRIEDESEGWVHRTTDGGLTWSGRILETDYPIRTVHFLTREIGFAAGGNYRDTTGGVWDSIGGIWSTSDGGETWQEDAALSAEVTVLGSRRESPVHVYVFAAGFYPDFIGGVWRTRVFLPDTGAVLVARPDTLDFGSILPGEIDTLSFWAANFGSRDVTVTELDHASPFFDPLSDEIPFDIAPGDSEEVFVTFQPDVAGIFIDAIRVLNNENQDVRVICLGEGRDVATDISGSALPDEPALSIYPNPGNPSFYITFSLPARADIQLVVYNLLGRRVALPADGFFDVGIHHVIWLAKDLPSGIYFVRLEGIPSPQTRKLFLMR